ncbi:hypothetical protein [Moritella sp. 24]|nr:hypothetical protein [Moritella sp. 24]
MLFAVSFISDTNDMTLFDASVTVTFDACASSFATWVLVAVWSAF